MTATEEIQELLNFLLPHAERMLNQHGEFYPYAAAVDSEGDLAPVPPAVESEDPDVGDILVALHSELRGQAAEGSIRASGIAADVTLTDPDSGEVTAAVQVELVDIYVPYETKPEGVAFGELVAAQGREPVFADAGEASADGSPGAAG
jgi:hypothetical protein